MQEYINDERKDTENSYYSISFDVDTIVKSLLLLLATFISHYPSIIGGFIWDDDAHVTKVGLRSLEGLWMIWTKLGSTQQYYPLLHSLFWIESFLWGDNAVLYHIFNILLHTIACLFLVKLLNKLEIKGAWLAGFIFAVHPVHVESVAWITEQKNTLSIILYFISALYYIEYDSLRKRADYTYAILFFILALLSKSVTATLPAAILVIIWWKRGKLSWTQDVVPLLPWFLIAAGAGIFTSWVERVLIGAQGADYQSAVSLTPLTRCMLAGHAIWFYLYKLIIPYKLIFIYKHWSFSASNPVDYMPTLMFFVVFAYLVWVAKKYKYKNYLDYHYRTPLAALLFFSGTLFPVLGFANVYPFMFSYVADHFQYLASLGIIVPVASLISIGVTKLSCEYRNYASVLIGVCISTLGFASWNQCEMYKDAKTLYTTTIERNPFCWMAYNNLGAILLNNGEINNAFVQFEKALKIRPNYPDARSNMCSVLIRLGRPKEALEHGFEATRLRNSPENHNNLGIALIQVGRVNEAIDHYNQAIKLKADYVEALNNIANAYNTLGRKQDAFNAYQAALKYNPNFADAYSNLGLLLTSIGKWQEALAYQEQAVRLQPSSDAYHANLGLNYSSLGRYNESIVQLRIALEINRNSSDAWYILGNAYAALNKFQEAEGPYLNSLKLNSANIACENNLAAVYFRLNRIQDAVIHYQIAIRLNDNYAEAHSNLGVALASSNKIDDAIAEYEKAIKLNPSYADAYNNLGIAQTSQNRIQDSVNSYIKAIKINTNNPEYHQNLSKSYSLLKDDLRSNAELETVRKLKNK